MIKRLLWFTTGLAAGAGAVVVLGKRMKRRLAELTPVRLADRGVQRIKQVRVTVGQALKEGGDAMRSRERELQDRLRGGNPTDRDELDQDTPPVIVLQDHRHLRDHSSQTSPTSKATPSKRATRKR